MYNPALDDPVSIAGKTAITTQEGAIDAFVLQRVFADHVIADASDSETMIATQDGDDREDYRGP